jgi:magnesium chelatase family protein
MHLDVPAVGWRDLRGKRDGKPSARVRARVTEARERAAGRLAGRANAEMGAGEIAKACRLDALGEDRLRAAVERFGLSARAYHRILRVARTIADLAGRDRITPDDVAEAIQYRVLQGR